MPSHELITVLIPLPTLVLTTLIDTTTSLQSLLEQLVEENRAQLEREIVGRAGAGIEDWGLVRVRRRVAGSEWAEGEVVDDELLDSSIHIADSISIPPPSSPPTPTTTRPPGPTHQFSSFALSAHLTTPTLRLVHLPSYIRIELVAIPGFPESGPTRKWYTGHGTTAGDVIEGVVELMGVRKVIPGAVGRLEFILLTPNGAPLAYSARLTSIDPPSSLTLTLSDKSLSKLGKTTSTPAHAPGWRPTSIFGSLWSAPPPESPRPDPDDEESEPTLKLRAAASSLNPAARLSALFTPWDAPAPPEPPARPRIVSQPTPLGEDPRRFSSWTPGMGRELDVAELLAEEEGGLELELEGLMDDLGMKPPQRQAMRLLPPDRQRFLIAQHRAPSSPLRASRTGPSTPKRFSLWAAAPDEPVPLTPSSTGGHEPEPASWSSWWTAASNATGAGGEEVAKDTPRFYVDQLRSVKISQRSLVKHLIALRVRLSTAKVAWTDEFLGEQSGMDAIEELLGRIVLRRRTEQADSDETVLGECIKCLRVLLNTDAGFTSIHTHPTLITHLTSSLPTPSFKLRALAADVLAALCVLSLHDVVLSALSTESPRFGLLVESLALPEPDDDGEGEWEWRTAGMSLVNALVNSPDDVAARVALRDEFATRGLNEVMVSLRYVEPPEALLTQLELYAEERQEDLDEIRERANREPGSDRVGELERLGLEHPELYPLLLDISTKLVEIYDKPDVDAVFRSDILNVVESFVEQASRLDGFTGWNEFVRSFLKSVEHVVGESELRIAESQRSSTDQSDKENFSSVFERLRGKEAEVVELQAEVARLRLPIEDADTKKERGERNRYYESQLDESKTLVLTLESTLEARDKEIKYLSRALESVYSRFRSSVSTTPPSDPPAPESVVDPEDMASRSIEALQQRDLEIKELKDELAKVKSELAAQIRLPKAFARRAPAPPPSSGATSASGPPTRVSPGVAIPPTFATPPPAPPPPPVAFSISAPPPPPPPPAPPAPPGPPRPAFLGSIAGAKLKSSSPTSNGDSPGDVSPAPIGRPAFLASISNGAKLRSAGSSPAVVVSGAPPPPPPPPPAFGAPPPPPVAPAPLVRRTTIRASQKKMKPFFWTKLAPTSVSTSIWASLPSAPLDFADLERDFATGAPAQAAPKPTAATGKKQPTTVLGLARAQNIAIMLARLKMPHRAVRDAVLVLDDKSLSLENLKAIKHFTPSTEEMEAIRNFDGDITSLAASDQYLNEMMVIPRLGDRLTAMLYRRRLEMEQEELKPELNILRSAADELKNSVKFQRLLATVLSLGNALNASTFRGDADGFQLEALLKLKDTRAATPTSSTPTLLHFLARTLQRSDPSLLSFLDDAPHVEAASRVSFATIAAAANALVSGVGQVQEEVRVLRRMRISPDGDRFVGKMESFVARAEPAMSALKSMMGDLDRDLKELVRYYGEDPASMKPEDLFGIVVSFSSSLLRAANEVAATDKNRPTSRTRRSLHPKDASSGDGGHRSLGRGGFDDAIRDLRNGTRRQRSSMGQGGVELDISPPHSYTSADVWNTSIQLSTADAEPWCAGSWTIVVHNEVKGKKSGLFGKRPTTLVAHVEWEMESRLESAAPKLVMALTRSPHQYNVQFVFPRDGRELWAHLDVLTAASPYFKSLFSSGFMDYHMAAERFKALGIDRRPLEYQDSDDDEALAPPVPPSDSPSHACTYPHHRVEIKQDSFLTYQALLCYINTGHISWAPLTSSFVEVVYLDERPRPARRAEAVLNLAQYHPSLPALVSPKSVYRLAHRLEMPALQKLALDAIRSGLSLANVAEELFAETSWRYDEALDVVIEFAITNREALRKKKGWGDALGRVEQLHSGTKVALWLARSF